ncbi:acireductone dioxygenase, partial [Pseudomonas sp. GD03860]
MSSLTVYHQSTPDIPNKVLTHLEDIAATLAEQGVRFERWHALAPLQSGASDEEVIAAYRQDIDSVMSERGYTCVDVIRATDTRLLDEHTRDQDLVRFFAAGRGLFSLHIDDYLYAVLCEKNDLICVPAGVRHWVDMGDDPRFVAIGLGTSREAGVVTSTGEKIAEQFPR